MKSHKISNKGKQLICFLEVILNNNIEKSEKINLFTDIGGKSLQEINQCVLARHS